MAFYDWRNHYITYKYENQSRENLKKLYSMHNYCTYDTVVKPEHVNQIPIHTTPI